MQSGNFLLDAADLRPAQLHFFVQSFAALSALANAGTEVAFLLDEYIDFLLQALRLAVERGDLVVQPGEFDFRVGNVLIERGSLFAQLAQLALARKDAALRM